MTDLLSSPTYRATRGRTPIFRPQMNGEDFPITVQEATFMLGAGQHDSALLKCTSTELTTTDGMLNSTIAFYWGQAPRTELFCGYIVNVEEVEVGKGNINFTLDVMASTQPMQAGRPRFWRSKTVPSAVQALAYTNALGFHSHDDTYLWPALAQTDESDWTTANLLSDRLGWSIFSRYGVVMCYDPAKLHKDQGVYTTLVSAQDQADFDPTFDRRLIEFNPQEKSKSVPSNYGFQIAYFTDNGDVQVTKQSGTFKRYKFVTNFCVNGAEEADIYANGEASRPSSWDQSADARMWGDSDIYPGMCVDVVTSNTRYLRQKFDGRWLVQAVGHHMDVQQFQTQLSLVRPSSTAPITQDPYRSFWDVAGKARPTLSLQNGVWQSSWTNPTVSDVL